MRGKDKPKSRELAGIPGTVGIPSVQIDPFAAGSASAKWHAAKWQGFTSRSGGSSCMQTSFV